MFFFFFLYAQQIRHKKPLVLNSVGGESLVQTINQSLGTARHLPAQMETTETVQHYS